MSPETLEHVFEPFWTTKAKGTGLGLSTVYGIVKRSQGFITVESAIGAGTEFEVYLPEVEGAAGSGVEAPGAESPGAETQPPGEATILLVEDDPAARKLIGRLLEMRGYRVLTAEDGKSALEVHRGSAERIDLLVTDVVMPGMTGPQLARLMAERRPGLPVLFLSGYPEDALGERGVLTEGTEFLGKPFNSQELARKVEETLRAAAERRKA
jgi:CheY-like chemotaxis protein